MPLIGTTPSISKEDLLRVIDYINSSTSVHEVNYQDVKFYAYTSKFIYMLPHIGSLNNDHLGRFWGEGFSDNVLAYFNSEKINDDPVRKYVMKKGQAFWLTELKEPQHQMDEAAMERINLALDNIGDGVLSPLFGPFNRHAYGFISFENSRDFYHEIFSFQIHNLMQTSHVKYCIIRESLKSHISLTPRENDVLELITFGKSNPEIGEILNISKNTVTGYVKQIFLKLGVSDRVSAALRARNYHIGN